MVRDSQTRPRTLTMTTGFKLKLLSQSPADGGGWESRRSVVFVEQSSSTHRVFECGFGANLHWRPEGT